MKLVFNKHVSFELTPTSKMGVKILISSSRPNSIAMDHHLKGYIIHKLKPIILYFLVKFQGTGCFFVSSNWSVTLGRFDVYFSVSTMGIYNSAPIKGHIGSMLRIFGYLNHHMKFFRIFDTRLL